jgi:hypothetical protein
MKEFEPWKEKEEKEEKRVSLLYQPILLAVL